MKPGPTAALELLPAIDIVDGRAVRLTQGRPGSESYYGDPVEAASSWALAGAKWLHVVDLDAAFGRGTNNAVIREIVHQVSGLKVEVSGGLRDDDSLEGALASGAARVNLGTSAVENPAWTATMIAKFGDAVAVGIDVRAGRVVTRGWTQDGGDLWEVLDRLTGDGCARYVVTDTERDGTMRGPNLELLASVAEHTKRPVIASGGISSLADIAAIRDLVPQGIEGAILGKALYENAFSLEDALRQEVKSRDVV